MSRSDSKGEIKMSLLIKVLDEKELLTGTKATATNAVEMARDVFFSNNKERLDSIVDQDGNKYIITNRFGYKPATKKVRQAALEAGYWLNEDGTILFNWTKDPTRPPNNRAEHK